VTPVERLYAEAKRGRRTLYVRPDEIPEVAEFFARTRTREVRDAAGWARRILRGHGSIQGARIRVRV
jgi:hypothetical protein